MSKKVLAVLAALGFLFGLVIARPMIEYYFPQTAVIPSAELTIYINGDEWVNGTAIDWGNVTAGEAYSVTLNVTNTGGVTCNVTLIIVDLPAGWTETWQGNNTQLAPGESVSADLVLTVPQNAASGAYTWDSYVRGEIT